MNTNNDMMTWAMYAVAAFVLYKFMKGNTSLELFDVPKFDSPHANQNQHQPQPEYRPMTEEEQVASLSAPPSGKEYAAAFPQ